MAQIQTELKPTPALTQRQLCLVVGGATLLTSMNFSLIFVAFGKISDTFGHSQVVPWALTGFSITSASLLVPAGWMADRFGRERMLLGGIGLFTVGSALVSASPWVGVLVAGRVVQAMGLVLESSAALPILLDAFTPSQRATVVGSLGATGGAAAAIGPVLGGALVDTIGWRATFALNVPVGALLALIVIRRLPMSRPQRSPAPPDLVGVAALASGMAALVFAITQVKTWGLIDVRTAVVALVSLAMLTLVVLRSGRHPDPVLHLPLFREPSYRRGVALNVLIAGTFAGTFLSFIRLLTSGWGYSTFHAGVAVAVVPLFGGPLSFVAGRIVDRHGPKVVIFPGALMIVAAGLIFSLSVTNKPNIVGLWLPVGSLYGIGVGFAHAACHASALRDVPNNRLGIGGAMSRIGMETGGIISVAVAVALVTSADDPVSGVRSVTLLVSAVCAVGAVLSLRLPPNRDRSST
jgi:MFS family permease